MDARRARNLTLTQVFRVTRISPWILRRIEAGEFAGLPKGIYARSYVRAYASAIGLDPERTVMDLEPSLPRNEEPLELIAKMKATRPGRPVASAEDPPFVPRVLEGEASRVPRSRLYAAALVDGCLLGTVSVLFLQSVAVISGASASALLGQAPLPFAFLFTILLTAYSGLLGGVAGRTAGSYLLGVELVGSPDGPIDLAVVGRRTVRCVLSELGLAAPGSSLRASPVAPAHAGDGERPATASRVHVLPPRIRTGS